MAGPQKVFPLDQVGAFSSPASQPAEPFMGSAAISTVCPHRNLRIERSAGGRPWWARSIPTAYGLGSGDSGDIQGR